MKLVAMNRVACFLLTSLLLLGLWDSSAAQEPLRWKLEKGQRFQLQTTQTTESLVTFGPRKLPTTMEVLLVIGWEVQQADQEQFTIEQQVDAIRIDMKASNEIHTIYDSRERKAVVGAAKELQASVAPLLGKKFTLVMNSQGEISSAKVAGESAAGESAAAIPGLDASSIEALLRQAIVPLPKTLDGSEPTWTDERQTKVALGELTQKRTFTLAGNEDRDGKPAAKITVTGELSLTPPADQKLEQKSPPRVKESKLQGTIWFAREAGRLLSSETTQRLVTESTYRDSTITVQLDTTVKSTLTPRE
jgi:hypothetical protein